MAEINPILQLCQCSDGLEENGTFFVIFSFLYTLMDRQSKDSRRLVVAVLRSTSSTYFKLPGTS